MVKHYCLLAVAVGAFSLTACANEQDAESVAAAPPPAETASDSGDDGFNLMTPASSSDVSSGDGSYDGFNLPTPGNLSETSEEGLNLTIGGQEDTVSVELPDVTRDDAALAIDPN